MTRKITLLMTSSLMFLLLVLASSVRFGAEARAGRMGASPAATQGSQSCDPPITISEVRYLGKVQGEDEVRVLWTASGGCLSVENKDFNVEVRVIRHRGHVDIKSVTLKVTGAQQNTLVRVPRGVTETDPEKYEVTITGSATGNVSTDAAPREATLAEASGVDGKTFAVAQSAATCDVASTVTGIAYKGRSAGKDNLEIRGNVASACFRPLATDINLTIVTQAAGQPEKQTTFNTIASHGTIGNIGPFNASFSRTVEVPVTPGTFADPIIRFKVQLKGKGSANHTIFGSKFGNF